MPELSQRKRVEMRAIAAAWYEALVDLEYRNRSKKTAKEDLR